MFNPFLSTEKNARSTQPKLSQDRSKVIDHGRSSKSLNMFVLRTRFYGRDVESVLLRAHSAETWGVGMEQFILPEKIEYE